LLGAKHRGLKNLSTAAQTALTPRLASAYGDYLDARYSACIDVCRELAAAGTPDRSEALVLQARAFIRLNRPADAVAVLVAELPEFADPAVRLDAEMRLAFAHATMNDFANANLYVAQLDSSEVELAPIPLRSEIANNAALVAWMHGDLDAADAASARARVDVSPFARGRNLITESWIAAKRGDYRTHAQLMLEGAETLQTADTIDVGMLAAATRALCTLSRDLWFPGLLRASLDLNAKIAWTDDLAVDQFLSSRALGWAIALEGPGRYFESLRLLHRASSMSPSTAWSVMALVDRARMKRYAGELASSSADLYEALELSKKVAWGETGDEERIALLYLAELFASVDVREASALMLQFGQVHESFSGRIVLRGDQRLDALHAFSSGVIHQALADARKAKHFLEAAYFTFDEMGYKWRAAQAALHLYQVTHDASWHELARERIRDYPQSWIAADVRSASTGVADEGWNRLTPRQREVFSALCEGLTAKRIADRLDCSPNTVRNHIHWIYQAFRVQSQPELITEARKRQLL